MLESIQGRDHIIQRRKGSNKSCLGTKNSRTSNWGQILNSQVKKKTLCNSFWEKEDMNEAYEIKNKAIPISTTQ